MFLQSCQNTEDHDSDSWTLCCTCCPLFILLATNRHDIIVLKLVRSLRVVRVIRLATHIPGFDQILAACTYPGRVLLNVSGLLAIGVYVFANIGVALFSDVEIEVGTTPGLSLPCVCSHIFGNLEHKTCALRG